MTIMTKDKIITALEKAEVDFDPTDKKEVLQSLLDGLEDEDDSVIEEKDGIEADMQADQKVPSGKGVHIFDKNGSYIRTHTDEMMGKTIYKNAHNYAKSLCEKNVGWTFKEVK